MTLLDETAAHHELDLALRQLRAIDAFHAARVQAQSAAETLASTREQRMDAARRLEVLRREHEALIARTHQQMSASCDLLRRTPAPRALVAHRGGWFTDKLVALLEEQQLEVVERVDNGADAIGIAVAEQPDLLFVEDGLLMVTGEEVVRETRRFCPDTRIGVQVQHVSRMEPMLEAGADAATTRQASPAEVSQQLLELLTT